MYDSRLYLRLPRVLLDEFQEGDSVILSSEEAHHLKVRRVGLNETFLVTDGRGREGVCRLISLEPPRLRVERVSKPLERELSSPPILAFAVVKDPKLEWAVRCAVEAGIRELLPVVTSRSLPGVSPAKVKRWQRVAIEAMKQCGGVITPRVMDPLPLHQLKMWRGGFLSTAAPSLLVEEGWNSVELLVVGPEGGFAPEEERMMREWGWGSYGLGARVLRTGTAVVTVSALVAQGRWSERRGHTPGD